MKFCSTIDMLMVVQVPIQLDPLGPCISHIVTNVVDMAPGAPILLAVSVILDMWDLTASIVAIMTSPVVEMESVQVQEHANARLIMLDTTVSIFAIEIQHAVAMVNAPLVAPVSVILVTMELIVH